MTLIADGLRKGHAPALLIGGHALSAFGYQRQTVDVDFLMTTPDVQVLQEVLTGAGYREIERTETFIHFTHPDVSMLDVDVMLVDRDTFDKLYAESLDYSIGKALLRVPCVLHLIALKLHAMKNNPKRGIKDLVDMVTLLQVNPGVVTQEELVSVCERYGPANVIHQIQEHL